MPRLTIASLTSNLAAQGINLTKEKKGYSVVMVNGYSFHCDTLTEVVTAVDLNRAYDDSLLTSQQIKEADVKAGVQTHPTEAEIMSVQSTRVNQLISYATKECDLEIDWLPVDNTLKQDEEEIATELVRQAEERREQLQPKQMSECQGNTCPAILPDFDPQFELQPLAFIREKVICRGFGTNTPRVSSKLQRRANRFHQLLAA